MFDIFNISYNILYIFHHLNLNNILRVFHLSILWNNFLIHCNQYSNINDKLFEKLFNILEVNLNNAERACQNYYRFDTFTAHDMFVSNLFANLEGEFEARELINFYLKYVFFKGIDIGILNGKMFFVYDIQEGFLNYYKIQNMNSEEKSRYLIKELFD